MIPEEQRVVIVLFHMWQSLQVNQDLSSLLEQLSTALH